MGNVKLQKTAYSWGDTRNCLPELMDAGLRDGTLTSREYQRIQGEMIELVQKQGRLWTGGEGGSLPVEVAEKLLGSILYIMGLEVKYGSLEEGLVRLKTQRAGEIFDKGLEKVRRRVRICRHRWQYLKGQLFETSNRLYNDTAKRGLGGFFKLYDPALDALELHITADYTPCLGRPEEGGIEFIESYLSRLEAENAFCRCFLPERGEMLLENVLLEVEEGTVNLFEQFLLGALACTLAGENPRKLVVSAEGCEAVEKRLQQQGYGLVQEGWEKVSKGLALSKKVREYGDLCLPAVGERMVRGAENEVLGKVAGTACRSNHNLP